MKLVAFVAALALASGVAFADPLPLNNSWQHFHWMDAPGTFAVPSFEFDSRWDTIVQITDMQADGDQFLVFDFGVLIGATSLPTDSGQHVGNNPDAGYLNPDFSSGEFFFDPGPHSLTIQNISIPSFFFPYRQGLGAIRAYNPNPEPGTMALLGGVLAGGAVFLRRRRRKQKQTV